MCVRATLGILAARLLRSKHCSVVRSRILNNFSTRAFEENLQGSMVVEKEKKMCSMSRHNYEDAIRLLNGLQTNAATIQKLRKERGRMQRDSLPEMESFLARLGIRVDDLNQLNAVHVSGTKGKGSTCALVESIMRQNSLKTGLYTSPHLVEVRERIRINGKPLPRVKFAEYFFQCFDMLTSTAADNMGQMPSYFRFLTLLAFHIFLKEQVDVAVVEVGIGGTYDCTNILPSPIVCGITLLDMDHTSLLGDTIDKIAWHKAGIMKAGRLAITIPQHEAAMTCLMERARVLKAASLSVAPPFERYQLQVALNLEGRHQEMNASLALQLCKVWFSEKRGYSIDVTDSSEFEIVESSGKWVVPTTIRNRFTHEMTLCGFDPPASFVRGLSQATWPGRCMTIKRKNVSFYLDGAHTKQSMEACKDWLCQKLGSEREVDIYRVLIFNISGDRDAKTLLRPLQELSWDNALFCPNIVKSESDSTDGSSDQVNFTVTTNDQYRMCLRAQQAWLDLRRGNSSDSTDTSIFPTINEAVRWVVNGRDDGIQKPMLDGPSLPSKMVEARHLQLVVVGSLHLVGGVLRFLGPDIVDLESC